MRTNNAIAAICLMCLHFVCTTVWSDAPPAAREETKKRAQTYFQRGELLFENGEYLKAAEAFTSAYKILPHYTVLANIALAYEHAGAFHLAMTPCREYLAEAAENGEKNPRIEALLEKLLHKTAQLDIDAQCSPAICRVHVDSRDHGPAPVHLAVLPGEHHLMAVQGSHIVFTAKLTVSAGETIQFTMGESAAQDGQASTQRDKKSRLGGPFWIAAGITVSAGIASSALWGATLATKKEFDSSNDLEELEHLKEVGERRHIGALVTIGIAGASAIAAIVLAAVGRPGSREEAHEPTPVSFTPEGIRLVF